MKTALRTPRTALLTVTLLTVCLSLATVACGGADTTDTTQAGSISELDGVRLAMSDLARNIGPAPDEDTLATMASIQVFGTDLYQLLASDAGDGNVVFSPMSIVTALAMTYAGANGETAQEMADTLHFTISADAIHKAFSTLDNTLALRNFQQKNAEGKDEGVLIKTANSLWAQDGLTFEQAFLDTLAVNYSAGVRLVDYQTAAEAAREAINKWVSGQTNDKIPELLAEGVLDSLTRLVLVNAVYLDATWANQFDPNSTHDGDFTTLSGETVTAEMMSQSAVLPYSSGEGWQAVLLPYLQEDLDMMLIVPDQGRFAEVEGQLADGLIDTAAGTVKWDLEVALTMPKFKFRTQTYLTQALGALGMKAAFNPDAADFSGMTKQESLYISDVIHEAYIDVDEEGTEAAAATAVVMRLTSAMPTQPVELTIDRPFIFVIRDRPTGIVLFMGRVTDPTK
jgi:serpin B